MQQINNNSENVSTQSARKTTSQKSPYATKQGKKGPIQAKQRPVNKNAPKPRTIDPFEVKTNAGVEVYQRKMTGEYGGQSNGASPIQLKAATQLKPKGKSSSSSQKKRSKAKKSVKTGVLKEPHKHDPQRVKEQILKFSKRQKKLNDIVYVKHQPLIAEICKKKNYTIAVRETGPYSIKRIGEGAMAKPHTILEKSVKDSSLLDYSKADKDRKATPKEKEQAAELLKKTKVLDIDGFVGHWNPKDNKNPLLGLVIGSEHKNKEYVKTDSVASYVPVNLNDEKGGAALEQLKADQKWKTYLYTGDYDLHEVYNNRMMQIPEATREKTDLLSNLNAGIATKDKTRTGNASLKDGRVHMDGNYAMFQHGDQATYRMNQHLEAEVSKKAMLVKSVATETQEPLGWCIQGFWYVTLNQYEHDLLREKYGITKPHTWSKEDDERMAKGKQTEEFR